jgi:hypothetical protein
MLHLTLSHPVHNGAHPQCSLLPCLPRTVCLLQHMEAQLAKFEAMLKQAGLELQRGASVLAACTHTKACCVPASVPSSTLRSIWLLHVRNCQPHLL